MSDTEDSAPSAEVQGGENFSKGYQILKELKDETKIDSSAHEAYKDKFYRLHKQLEQNYSNEK
jgi:hypothetical protein